MIDKAKDILIIIGAGLIAILAYILSQKDKKIGELYYQAKSESYLEKMKTLEKDYDGQKVVAQERYNDYNKLKLKYLESSSKVGGSPKV